MSILQYPETATASQLQVWNNAAFDGEEYQGFSFPMKASWSSLHSSESLRSDCSKENLSPAALNSTPLPAAKPLLSTAKKKNKGFDEREDEKKIDDEIQEIENEIKRLSSRLEALRLQKAAAAAAAAVAKTAERRGRIVPAKFMEQKQSASAVKIIEETPKAKVGGMMMRRGVSLGPAEISAGGGGRFSSRPGKANVFNVITPVPAAQSRRKSCFWKLADVDEVKGVNERKKTLSLSPKSKRNVGVQKQGAATVTVGSRKSVKKEDGVVALVQPRKLFKEGEKSVPNKRPAKPGRVVASRYNQIAAGNNNNNNNSNNSVAVDARKRSLPENDKDDGSKRWDKRLASLRGSGQGEVRVKKRWEIPAQVKVREKSEEEEEEEEVADMSAALLPKIRTFRYPNESPRDSGAAKRVADLTGKRSYFCPDEGNQDMEASLCQVLSFAEDDADEEG